MQVSLIQMNSVSDKAANLAEAARLIEIAVEQERPDWVSLPECFDFLGAGRREKFAAAEVLPGGPAYSPVSYTHLDVYKRQKQAKASTDYSVDNQISEAMRPVAPSRRYEKKRLACCTVQYPPP